MQRNCQSRSFTFTLIRSWVIRFTFSFSSYLLENSPCNLWKYFYGNVSFTPTFCANRSPNRGFSLNSQGFSSSRLIPESYLVTRLPASNMHSESLQKLFSWVFQVCNSESDTQMIIHAKEKKITLLFFCLCNSCPCKSGTCTPSCKLALCIVLTDPQLRVCLSAFLNKYTTIRPIQRPLTRSCLHISHSNKQNTNQQEGYDHLMSSQKFLSLASYLHPEHHGNCQPAARQNTSEYIGVSYILKPSQTFSRCLEPAE